MVTRQTPLGGDRSGTEHADDLWRFSCEVFEDPAVAKACLALQDDTADDLSCADVNIILFVTWLVINGWGPLDEYFLATVIKTARPWQKDVVRPLRALRRELKALSLPEARKIRTSVQHSEIAAERAEQTALVEVMAILHQCDDVLAPQAMGDEIRLLLEKYMAIILGNEMAREPSIRTLIGDYITAIEPVLINRSA